MKFGGGGFVFFCLVSKVEGGGGTTHFPVSQMVQGFKPATVQSDACFSPPARALLCGCSHLLLRFGFFLLFAVGGVAALST